VLAESAARLAHVLRIEHVLASELLQLAAMASPGEPASAGSDSDLDRARASATRALSGVAGASCDDLLERLLDDANQRVRASAVESIGARSQSHASVAASHHLVELKVDPHHRVRSTAMCWLIRSGLDAGGPHDDQTAAPGAVASLIDMLGDQRPLHRLAALWAAESVGVGEVLGSMVKDTPGSLRAGLGARAGDVLDLVSRVAERAALEPDDAIRARATSCVQSLVAQARFGLDGVVDMGQLAAMSGGAGTEVPS
jgi:hypothetical protein